MTQSIIVYGPQGSGKTRHAERIRLRLNLDHIVDEGEGRDTRSVYERYEASASTLYLTHQNPPDSWTKRSALLHINLALRAIGVADQKGGAR